MLLGVYTMRNKPHWLPLTPNTAQLTAYEHDSPSLSPTNSQWAPLRYSDP